MKILLPLLAALAAGCVSDSETSAPTGLETARSYGSVVEGDLDTVWTVTQTTLARLGSALAVDSSRRRAEADYDGARVFVQCEPYDARRTILRIGARRDGAEVPEVAERVQIAIQRELIR